MKSLQVCIPSSNARTQWGEAERPFLWFTLARLRRSPAGIIHTQYKTRTYKNSRKNSMTQLGFHCYDFLLFILGKGRREEISSDYTETHQRAQHSLECARCSADRLCFLFDFFFFISLIVQCLLPCIQVSALACHFFLTRHMETIGRINKVTLLVQRHDCRFRSPSSREQEIAQIVTQTHNVIVSLSLSPKLAAFIRYKFT